MTDGRIRRATPADVPEIVTMVRDLAEYERAAHEVVATEEQFHDALFGPDPKVFAHVIEHESGEGNLGGFAIWFLNFSTWLGRHGLYLEDLYVRPALRGSGYGKALLATLAQECVEHGYGRLEWWVLDWNEPALGFYRNLGALPMDDWTVHRVTGEDLHQLANEGGPWPTQ
ncbi:MAG: GNAT family N-acetyltransferase [Actinobacteria bacterium]|nr:GNAT family N-acetyltransferase [Actinomycetota bacterium]